jgi:hypothetical protein
MAPVLRALTGLALILPAATAAHAVAPKQETTAKPKKAAKPDKKAVKTDKAAKPEQAVDVEPAILPSDAAIRVADWVATSRDNHSLPYAIVDKTNGALFLFDGKGKPLDQVPVLVGISAGDDATPGVGSKKLAEIGPAEKTTPAGRYLAKFGLAFRKERILWVDYATSVALHPIPSDVGKKERRRERMLSPTPDDNRITFGCINVPKLFYGKFLRPQFQKKGGYVYILPDTKPLEEVFPRLLVQAQMAVGALQ